jgi:hypothetical protein
MPSGTSRIPVLAALVLCATRLGAQQAAGVEATQLFTNRVKPLLEAKCQGCHGAAKTSGLSLLSRAGMLQGGRRGAAIVPGTPSRSLLLSSVQQTGDIKMPPGQKLSDTDIAALRRWIELGAPWPDATVAASAPPSGTDDLWAFRPVRHYEPPGATLNPIDAFVLRKLKTAKLRPAPEADRRTLIRRATFDLTGLPPTQQEVAEFLGDPAPDRDAFGKVVERLLASPHYGERWGRHWLDVVRYADTGGYSNDFERPNAWRYRDYVIRAFNQDKPYNQFIREQLAGDELDPNNPEYLAATGFLRMGPFEQTAMSVAAETRQLWLDDVTHTTGAAFLGLTVECARCHDHKFDPLPTRDYYSLQAIFATTEFADRAAPFLPSEAHASFDGGRRALQELVRRNDEHLREFDDLARQRVAKKLGVASVDELPPQIVKAVLQKKEMLTGEEMERQKIYLKRKELYARSIERYSPVAYSVSDGPMEPKARKSWTPPEVFVLPVGNLKTPGEKVQPAVLTAVAKYASEPAQAIPPDATARRLVLANWIADARNPLTVRVIANRIWGYHFGAGIAGTPNDLGKMGKRPTDPELLDYLSEYFVQHGWSIKEMHRLIMLSDAYRRASFPADPKAVEKDDQRNELLSYFPPRRLEAEELRDSILFLAGELSTEAGGPGTFPELNRDVATQPQQIMGTLMPAYRPSPLKSDRHRRTIYTFQKRNLADPFLDVFNGPSLDASTDRRTATTIPTQVYALFNSQFTRELALAFANGVARDEHDPIAQVRATFLRVFQREPGPQETAIIQKQFDKLIAYHRSTLPAPKPERKPLLRSITSELTGAEVKIEEDEDPGSYEENLQPADVTPETRALADLALALFNTNGFVYVY